MKKRNVQISILCITILLSVLVCLILPERVAIQWNGNGPSNFASKYVAALIPIGVCILMLVSWNSRQGVAGRELYAPFMEWVWGAASCLGILLNIIILVMN